DRPYRQEPAPVRPVLDEDRFVPGGRRRPGRWGKGISLLGHGRVSLGRTPGPAENPSGDPSRAAGNCRPRPPAAPVAVRWPGGRRTAPGPSRCGRARTSAEAGPAPGAARRGDRSAPPPGRRGTRRDGRRPPAPARPGTGPGPPPARTP